MAVYSLPETLGMAPALLEFQMSGSIETTQSVFTGGIQRSEFPGDSWRARLTYENVRQADLPRFSAFWNHLRGGAHLLRLWNLKYPEPRGTKRGTPTLTATVAAGVSQIGIGGSGTLLPGDMVNIVYADNTRQLLQIYTDDGGGLYSVTPPLRKAASAGASIVWDRPYADFMPLSAPWISYGAGASQGFVLELQEIIS
jgi:hypothetical protein